MVLSCLLVGLLLTRTSMWLSRLCPGKETCWRAGRVLKSVFLPCTMSLLWKEGPPIYKAQQRTWPYCLYPRPSPFFSHRPKDDLEARRIDTMNITTHSCRSWPWARAGDLPPSELLWVILSNLLVHSWACFLTCKNSTFSRLDGVELIHDEVQTSIL